MMTMTTESPGDLTLEFLLLVLVGLPTAYMVALAILAIWKE